MTTAGLARKKALAKANCGVREFFRTKISTQGKFVQVLLVGHASQLAA
jgi:hypothetical protein